MFFLSVHVFTIHMFTAHLFTIHMFTTYMVTAHSFTTIFFLTRFPPQYRLDSIQVRWVTPTSTRRGHSNSDQYRWGTRDPTGTGGPNSRSDSDGSPFQELTIRRYCTHQPVPDPTAIR